jgi:hypothetical protein
MQKLFGGKNKTEGEKLVWRNGVGYREGKEMKGEKKHAQSSRCALRMPNDSPSSVDNAACKRARILYKANSSANHGYAKMESLSSNPDEGRQKQDRRM